MLMLGLGGWLAAQAAPPVLETPQRRPEIVLRGLVERWNEPALSAVYKSGTWLGGLGVVVPVKDWVGVDVELSFGRLRNEPTSFEIAPLSGVVTASRRMGAVDGFIGVGPTYTIFTERGGQAASPVVVDGARLAGELRAGLRADTRLVEPPSPPAPGGPIRRMDVEFYLARRSQLPGSGEGLSLGAWRASLGLGLAF